jgi:phosphate transport system permease protein
MGADSGPPVLLLADFYCHVQFELNQLYSLVHGRKSIQVADQPSESRFQVSRSTLLIDLWMGRIIRLGGISVVIAVFGMLAFLISQIFPLFSKAKVESLAAVNFTQSGLVALGEDEYGELPFSCDSRGNITFRKASDGSVVKTWAADFKSTVPNADGQTSTTASIPVTAVKTYPREGLVLLGLADGSIRELKVNYKIAFDKTGKRVLEPSVNLQYEGKISNLGEAILEAWSVKGAEGRLYLCRQKKNDSDLITGRRLVEKKGLGGKSKTSISEPFAIAADVTDLENVLVPSTADSLLVIRKTGEVRVYQNNENTFSLLQSFKPFGEEKNPQIAAAGFIFGNVSVVFQGYQNKEVVWSLYPQKQSDGQLLRRWGKIHDCENLSGAGQGVFPAAGNKCYLSVAGGRMQIRNMTNGSIRWETSAPESPIQQVIFSRNYNRLSILCQNGQLYRWSISDHHPEASWNTFFGKIWYEGAEGPAYTWQSSSGSDEFEAKYSLVPLIYGTIKGTFYALLFAIPIALLAAVYVSHFLRPEWKVIIKPLMEIMASLPSVVLGFLAGLWLAPLVDTHLIPLLCVIGVLAPSALLAGFIWSKLPQPVRRQVGPGWEFAYLFPFILICAYGAWHLGPIIETTFFTVKDLASGQNISDFREWWRQSTGLNYDARNSLVVGFVMGFAVIPIVFTIAEDALSNVPNALISGSLALGASRWQTVWSVVVPTAISGILSAIMIGFGRAVGETMIVVMATGNTAVMDANPFNGMRTLSANIAVELPEAAVGETHFRALFLEACCLFALTFIVNTFAETLRQRLRKRYKLN